MSREFGKAVVVMALVAGAVYAYKRWQTPAPPLAESERVPVSTGPAPVATIQDQVQEQIQEQAEDPITGPVIATVYECTGPEGRVLSDKPCANDARTLQVRAPNGMDPTKVKPPEVSKEAGSSSGNSSGNPGLGIAVVIPPLKTCAELNRSEALVNKRLREDQPEQYKKQLRQQLSEYAVLRKEWKCGRAR